MNTPAASPASAALDAMAGHEAWAAIRLRDSATVTLVGGRRSVVESLLDVPLEDGVPADGRRFDRLLAVPFRQVAERGFEAHDDGAPLVVVDIDLEVRGPARRACSRRCRTSRSSSRTAVASRPPTTSTASWWSGSSRTRSATARARTSSSPGTTGRSLADWDTRKALTVFRRLLERERGAYWTFCLFTGDRFLVGASPERHVSVHGGDVRMNPISGTFRLRGLDDPAERKERLLEFLADEKEIYELFMVVDEELKMMCDICNEGGQVLGPFLKPMTHLVHTEYLLAGRTNRDVRTVLRDTMYAATVTGSPVENACRLIKKYESEGRGYYGAALALLGRDTQGRPTADSPIVIRTAEVSPDGALKVTAGATLVRDSEAAYEVAETHAKAGGILTAFGLVPPAGTAPGGVAELAQDEDVLIALNSRNQRLSKFWLTDQGGSAPAPELKGRSAVILDGEDDFVNMLRHVLAVMGMTSTVVRHED